MYQPSQRLNALAAGSGNKMSTCKRSNTTTHLHGIRKAVRQLYTPKDIQTLTCNNILGCESRYRHNLYTSNKFTSMVSRVPKKILVQPIENDINESTSAPRMTCATAHARAPRRMTAQRPEPPTHGAGYDTRDCTRQSPQRVAAEQPEPPTHDRIVKNRHGMAQWGTYQSPLSSLQL